MYVGYRLYRLGRGEVGENGERGPRIVRNVGNEIVRLQLREISKFPPALSTFHFPPFGTAEMGKKNGLGRMGIFAKHLARGLRLRSLAWGFWWVFFHSPPITSNHLQLLIIRGRSIRSSPISAKPYVRTWGLLSSVPVESSSVALPSSWRFGVTTK